jgi:hypothetical protein
LTDALELTAKFWNNRNSQFAWILNWIMSKKYEERFQQVMAEMDSVRTLHPFPRLGFLYCLLFSVAPLKAVRSTSVD